MPSILFMDDSLAELMEWSRTDRKISDRVEKLLNDIVRNGADKGIGKPERLKHMPYWSRRIDDKNRLIYEVREGIVEVRSCKGHYED